MYKDHPGSTQVPWLRLWTARKPVTGKKTAVSAIALAAK